MHTLESAYETLEIRWRTYCDSTNQQDLDWMPIETIEKVLATPGLEREMRINAQMTYRSFYREILECLEATTKALLDLLPLKLPQAPRESHISYVFRCLAQNGMVFSGDELEWFQNANVIRNIITHQGGKPDFSKAVQKKLIDDKFDGIEVWRDGYLCLNHLNIAELFNRTTEFLRDCHEFQGSLSKSQGKS